MKIKRCPVMLKLRQLRKHLSCGEYLPAEISAQHNRYFIVIVPYYINYFVFVMGQAHDSSTK